MTAAGGCELTYVEEGWTLTAAVEQWDELVRIERLALDAGAGTQRDLLDAESGRYQARAGLVEARSRD